MTSRTLTRVALGFAAVLSVDEAASLLPRRDSDERAWLYARGLVRQRMLAGRSSEYVLWADVLRELGVEDATEGARPSAPQGTPLRRRALR